LALAIEHRHEVLAAEIAFELAFWASRSGVLETPPVNITGAYARQLTEGWAETAEHWQAAAATLTTYETLYPTCRVDGCQDDPEPRSQDCYRHQLVDAV